MSYICGPQAVRRTCRPPICIHFRRRLVAQDNQRKDVPPPCTDDAAQALPRHPRRPLSSRCLMPSAQDARGPVSAGPPSPTSPTSIKAHKSSSLARLPGIYLHFTVLIPVSISFGAALKARLHSASLWCVGGQACDPQGERKKKRRRKKSGREVQPDFARLLPAGTTVCLPWFVYQQVIGVCCDRRSSWPVVVPLVTHCGMQVSSGEGFRSAKTGPSRSRQDGWLT